MSFKDKLEQMYDWVSSMHNVLISIMIMISLGVGFYIYHITNQWYAIPLCVVCGFVFPLAENIRRRVTNGKIK